MNCFIAHCALMKDIQYRLYQSKYYWFNYVSFVIYLHCNNIDCTKLFNETSGLNFAANQVHSGELCVSHKICKCVFRPANIISQNKWQKSFEQLSVQRAVNYSQTPIFSRILFKTLQETLIIINEFCVCLFVSSVYLQANCYQIMLRTNAIEGSHSFG